jgi:tetratricopeptide (TPR) repeat protein
MRLDQPQFRFGEDALAWDYLTTPVAFSPNEAVAWQSLAKSLTNDQQYKLAERAYTAAFEAKPTNAALRWQRIPLLREAGRREQAAELLQQLAEGTWQPPFQHLQKRAAELISH